MPFIKAISIAIIVCQHFLYVEVLCKVPKDEVFSLPGWSGSLPTKQYSGYLPPMNSTTKKFHYWLVESENDPQNDPVVLWLTGGPGCSSLAGYFDELGPLHFDRTSEPTGLPTLIKNPYAWNKIANMIFLESPAGVGFSYSTNKTVDYKINDEQTALDNYGVLVNFFKSYPEYRKNDFYVSGESYAGIYVPTLVHTIMLMNENIKAPEDFINLKGFLVGNGCIGNEVGSCGHQTGIKIHVDFYHKHALISEKQYDTISSECKDFVNMSNSCSQLINEASKRIGNVNIYNIYTPCFSNLPPNGKHDYSLSRMRNFLKEHHLSHSSAPYYGPDECIDDHIESRYFNDSSVRTAIHVESINVTGGWRICTNKIQYIADTPSLLPIYPTLIKKYRTLIYNGDVDGCVPYLGDEMWTTDMGFAVKEEWRAWSVDDQVAGYVTEYDWNNFKFVTVKGSGHMVPQYRPKQAFALFERFLKNMPI